MTRAARASREHLLSSVGASLGLASLLAAWVLVPLVNTSHMAMFHWMGRPQDLVVPSLLDFGLVWVTLAGLLLTAGRTSWWGKAVWAAIAAFLAAVALKGGALYCAVTPPVLCRRGLWIGGLASFVVLLWMLRRGRLAASQVLDFSATLLIFLAIPGGLVLGRALWSGWQVTEGAGAVGATVPSAALARLKPKPRVIWIVFDELSYLQVYGGRFAGLQLPAFDALAAESTVFSRVKAAGSFTQAILPELLSGVPDDAVRASSRGRLLVHDPQGGGWRAFQQDETVFHDAVRAGYRTAIVGWYMPYCRMMPAWVDRCFWSLHAPVQNGMEPQASLPENMLRPLRLFLGESVWRRVAGSRAGDVPGSRKSEAADHVDDFEELAAAADKVVREPADDFVLLHMPVPHPPGIYDRNNGKLTDEAGTYLDNLALADRYLAHVRRLLEQSGQWETTTLVVMGDHGWRTSLWRPDADWTAEEERATHRGRFDPRPLYLVRFPGQRARVEVNAPFPALETRALLDGVLAGDLQTSGDLVRWVQQGPHGRGRVAVAVNAEPKGNGWAKR